MGTKADHRVKIDSAKVRLLINHGGPVAQLLHPDWISRDDPDQIGRLLLQTEELLSAQAPDVKLVLTGAGLLEVLLHEHRDFRHWKTEAALERLCSQCRDAASHVLSHLPHASRDYIFGVDFISEDSGVGQFGVLARENKVQAIIWKSYPFGTEANSLAGFGTGKGRLCPRVFDTNMGRTMVLVCHDAQAFNHRNKALVGRAFGQTARSAAMSEMAHQMQTEQPSWTLNLIHFIDNPASMKTFHRSFKQISTDHAWHPKAIGAFGYGKNVYASLASLAAECQFPPRTSDCVLFIEV